jgi:S1-C subfamily serine protease
MSAEQARARLLAVAAALALALGATACSSDREPTAGGEKGTGAAERTERQDPTTRAQPVEGLGEDGFDASSLYDRLSPGVVTVLSIFEEGGGPSLLEEDGGEAGQGSGFVLDDEGFVATNAHVVTTGEGEDSSRAEQVFVALADGNQVEAEIVGDDPNSDVALLKIDPAGLDLTPLELGRSDDLTVGQRVAAIGSPFGERQSLTTGVVSALDRAIESLTAFRIGNAIQTDAAINPGNSGGPLLDARGRVIGINAQIKSTSGGGEGVGFAIPANTVRRSLSELRGDGEVGYGYLGVTSQSLYPQLAQRLDLEDDTGALIVDVTEDSPAAKAGLEAGEKTITFQSQTEIPVDGDVIVAVDGKPLTRSADLADVISGRDSGEEVTLRVVRDGEARDVEVTLGERPALAPDALP